MIVKKLVSIGILAIVALVFSVQSHAWGQEGHRVVCQLAYDQLDATTKRQVKKLVGELSSKHRKNLNDYQQHNKSAKIHFANTCVWADAVKKMPEYKMFDAWHYVNVDRDAASVSSGYCLKGCVLEAIPTHYRVLQETSNSWDRAQALMFLSHWVADLHQPLHVGFRDDAGGNLLKVSVAGYETNFHKVWDSLIIDWVMELNGWDEKALAKNVSNINTMGFSTNYNANAPVVWAEESRLLAQQPQTAYCRQSKKGCIKPKGRPPYVLSSNYYAEHWPEVRLRLKLASQRLAATIESAL